MQTDRSHACELFFIDLSIMLMVVCSATCSLCLAACLQGNLDLLYLSTRYEKGLKWTEKFVTGHQRYEASTTLADAHAPLLRFQSEMSDGGDACNP